jgi:hypothetical protein
MNCQKLQLLDDEVKNMICAEVLLEKEVSSLEERMPQEVKVDKEAISRNMDSIRSKLLNEGERINLVLGPHHLEAIEQQLQKSRSGEGLLQLFKSCHAQRSTVLASLKQSVVLYVEEQERSLAMRNDVEKHKMECSLQEKDLEREQNEYKQLQMEEDRLNSKVCFHFLNRAALIFS